MIRPALALCAALAAASPALAQSGARPGDMTLSCEALAAEASQIETAQARRAQRAESGRKLMGFAGAAFNAAAPSLMARAGTGSGAIAAQTVVGAIQSGALSQPASEAEPPASPEAVRLERVHAMLAERGC